MSKKRFKKSILIPLALLVYSIGMFAYFLPKNSTMSHTEKGLIVAADLALLLFIWWIYRKREKMAEKRDQDITNSK